MFDLIYSPLKAIARAKRERSYRRTLLVLLAASVFSGVIPIVSKSLFMLSPWKFALALGAGLLVTHVLLAIFLQLVLHILTQRGGFYEALTTSSYGFFILSASFLVNTLLAYLKPYIGAVPTSIITTAVFLFSFILAYAVTLRTAVELFQADLFTIIIALLIVYMAVAITVYIFAIKMLMGRFTSLEGVSSLAKGSLLGMPSVSGMNPFG